MSVFALCALLLLLAAPVWAQEPLVTPQQECDAALGFNKQDFMRVRDQFVRVATFAEALQKKLDDTKQELDDTKGKLQEALGKSIIHGPQQDQDEQYRDEYRRVSKALHEYQQWVDVLRQELDETKSKLQEALGKSIVEEGLKK